MTITDAINQAWIAAYPDCREVTDEKALIKRVLSLADDRKCWLDNARANQKENNRLEAAIKQLLKPKKPKRIVDNTEAVIRCVAGFYELPVKSIKGRLRTAIVAEARHVIMWWLYMREGRKSQTAAEAVGLSCHSSTIHAVSRINHCIQFDRVFQAKWATLEPLLEDVVSRKEEVA